MGTRAIRGVLLALLPFAAALHTLAAASPERVEHLYSRGLYPRLLAVAVPVTSALPFSLAEWLAGLLVVGLPLLALARWRRGRRRGVGRSRLLGAGLVWTGGLVGLFYAWYLVAWGLNHQRPPAATLAGLDARPASAAELAALCAELVAETDALRVGRLEDERGVMRLAAGRTGALAAMGADYAAAATSAPLPVPAGPRAVVKRPLLSPLLWRLGITGIYVPFTAEPNVNDTVPDVDLPFVAAHELAHLRGFAREDEASWVGHLACARSPDPDHRYSGTLNMSLHALATLARIDRQAHAVVARRRSAAVLRDVAVLRAWAERYRGPARRVARRMNDTYLKSQGHPEGVQSYGRVVDLLLAERRARLAAAASPDP